MPQLVHADCRGNPLLGTILGRLQRHFWVVLWIAEKTLTCESTFHRNRDSAQCKQRAQLTAPSDTKANESLHMLLHCMPCDTNINHLRMSSSLCITRTLYTASYYYTNLQFAHIINKLGSRWVSSLRYIIYDWLCSNRGCRWSIIYCRHTFLSILNS